jgi:hypothetical protein
MSNQTAQEERCKSSSYDQQQPQFWFNVLCCLVFMLRYRLKDCGDIKERSTLTTQSKENTRLARYAANTRSRQKKDKGRAKGIQMKRMLLWISETYGYEKG